MTVSDHQHSLWRLCKQESPVRSRSAPLRIPHFNDEAFRARPLRDGYFYRSQLVGHTERSIIRGADRTHE